MTDIPVPTGPDAPDATPHSAAAEAAPAVNTPLDRAGWCARMDQLTAEEGYFESLGARHYAFLHDDGPILFLSFQPLDRILARPGQMPLGHVIAKANGWSHLCIVSDGDTWFRDPAVYGYFDRLVDDAFFEDFDRVLVFGAGAAGYAACAFSVCAPGAVVLAVSPRATLDPAVAGWDRRNLAARRLDFTTRYGYAPDMTEGAARVFVIYDPLLPENAMHAALFHAPWVTRLPAHHFGDSIENALELTGILPSLLTEACEGRLTAAGFARLWRVRRRFGPYLRGLLRKAELAQRPRLALMVCRSVVRRLGAPRFRRRMTELESQLGVAPLAMPNIAPAGAITPASEGALSDS